METTKQSRYPALRYQDFRLLWSGQFISQSGSQMQIVALNWHIWILTHSAFSLGIIGMTRFIPIVAFSLIGGSFADSVNRKKMLFVTQSLLAVFSLILAITTYTQTINSTIVYVMTALAAAALAFDTPARQALVPNLVKREHFANATSLNVIIWQVAQVVGPALGGIIIGRFGVGHVYLINAFSFCAVLIALVLMKNKGEVEKRTASVLSLTSIKEGLAFVKSKSIIWSTMLLDFFSTFFASATALMPIYADKILHVGPVGLGILYSAPAVGSLIAAVIAAHLGTIKKQGPVLLVSVALYGVATIIFGVSKIYLFSLFALALTGAGDTVSTIIRNTLRQLETPDHVRGRMVAINMIFFMGGPQLGEFEAGVLAAAIGAPASVVIGGIGTLVVVALTTIGVPKLRNYHGIESNSEKK